MQTEASLEIRSTTGAISMDITIEIETCYSLQQLLDHIEGEHYLTISKHDIVWVFRGRIVDNNKTIRHLTELAHSNNLNLHLQRKAALSKLSNPSEQDIEQRANRQPSLIQEPPGGGIQLSDIRVGSIGLQSRSCMGSQIWSKNREQPPPVTTMQTIKLRLIIDEQGGRFAFDVLNVPEASTFLDEQTRIISEINASGKASKKWEPDEVFKVFQGATRNTFKKLDRRFDQIPGLIEEGVVTFTLLPQYPGGWTY